MKNYFKRIFGENKKKFVFTTRNLGLRTGNGELMDTAGSNSGSTSTGSFITIDDSVVQSWGTISSTPAAEVKTIEDKRKVVQPKEVFEEIKKETPAISFENLDEKIRVVSERIEVLKEHLDESHLRDEHMTLFYLENRRKYLKTRSKYPIDWAMTTRDAVNDLCKNYKLKSAAIKQYYTLIPKEGISEMDRYTKAYKAITGDNPIYELIIKDVDYKSEEKADKVQKKKDRDPILLANSPFGSALFVLGAWDEEVEVVDEIIYGLK